MLVHGANFGGWCWRGVREQLQAAGLQQAFRRQVEQVDLPGLQILAGGKDSLQRALAMPVYEAPPSDDSHNEPRDLEVGDFNGDGLTDLAVLAFDRVLIYLQQK